MQWAWSRFLFSSSARAPRTGHSREGGNLAQANRGVHLVKVAIFSEEAEVLSQQTYSGEQYVLRLAAPRCAGAAQPGQFVHLQCDPTLRMRRPYSIMAASDGKIEVLYRVVGLGSRLLSEKRAGSVLGVLGPIGNSFVVREEYPRPLLLGGGVGMPPLLFLAESLHGCAEFSPFVLLASERGFPFATRESQLEVAGFGEDVRLTHAGLEERGMPVRLCSGRPQPGCPGYFRGFIHEAADAWLSALSEAERDEVEIFACGPQPMLRAVARLAHEWGLPCRLSLEEYMACAIGGCAGCVVAVEEQGRTAMRRVCAEGPIFDAATLCL